MGKIFYVMGKSASGKDTIYKRIREEIPVLKTVLTYTTRPAREGEHEGVEYHFITGDEMERLAEAGKVIECRTYQTNQGPWSYATVDDGQFNENCDYLMIGTLESYRKVMNYFGRKKIVPIYIEVEDGERLSRALNRERLQRFPDYAELCRRYLADDEDFKEEELRAAGIKKRYINGDMECCVNEIIVDLVKIREA